LRPEPAERLRGTVGSAKLRFGFRRVGREGDTLGDGFAVGILIDELDRSTGEVRCNA